MILSLYRSFGTLGAPLIAVYLNRRKARGKEDKIRFGERLGKSHIARPKGPLVWLHAASVGESLSLLPLIERMVADRPQMTFVLTTGTVTSASLMAERLPQGVIHQYVPVDRAVYVRRFFDHWRPDLVLWSESDFWPNLVMEPARRSIPLILINGRISPNSFTGWRRFPGVIRQLLAGFAVCLAQTDADAERLKQLGATPVRCVGNLKFAVKPLPVEAGDLAEVSKQLAGRPRWFAASTHPGEEELLWQVHQRVALDHPGLMTLIAPRHPNRGSEIARSLRAHGAQVARRAAGDPITGETQIYLADTLGEMGLFFRSCQLVFMGKSLVDKGGQNPLEAANLECAILHGPHMWNFQEIVERLHNSGAAIQVANPTDLADALSALLSSPDKARAMAASALAFVGCQGGILDAVCEELAPFLDRISSHERSP